jgi:anti-anti-sigma factor
MQHVTGALRGQTLVATVTLNDIRDSAVAYALRDQILALVESTGASHVVLDLINVRSIGSIGFLAFLAVRRRLPGGRIVLCNLSDAIRRTFELCRLIAREANPNAPFEVEETVEAAVARVGA